jgi:catechol 2,3-dioxygenase-like lactoylglutathione lyase family enzyme
MNEPTTKPKFAVRGLHHHAFRSCDIEKTRHFYEDILGLPLIGTFVETENPVYKDGASYIHIFLELGDGSCLAFFQFQPNGAPTGFAPRDPFDHHIALEVDGIEAVKAAEQRYKECGLEYMILDHGYVYSIYTTDPNGMVVELTTKVAVTDEVMAERRRTAHEDLKTWLDGVTQGNNRWRNTTETVR